MLIKQQDRIEDRVQDIEEQLYKLESDKCLMEVSVKCSSIDELNHIIISRTTASFALQALKLNTTAF